MCPLGGVPLNRYRCLIRGTPIKSMHCASVVGGMPGWHAGDQFGSLVYGNIIHMLTGCTEIHGGGRGIPLNQNPGMKKSH